MLQEILKGLTNILGPIATLSKEQRELKDMALNSISTALKETYIYYRDVEKGQSFNKEDKEAMLVNYWAAAAIPIRHFDQELALQCQQKSEYWINPNSYTNDDVKRLGISLDDVRRAYHKLLSPIVQR